MTEAEWLTATDQIPMMESLEGTASDRKLRLFFCWLARQRPGLMADDISRRGVEAAEQYADGFLCDQEREAERLVLQTREEQLVDTEDFGSATIIRESNCCLSPQTQWFLLHPGWGQKPQNSHIIRDIFGNPFRPTTVDPATLTSTIVALADGIYTDRAFDRLPILADALQDAGCDSGDLLNHLRSDGPHVRGCWALDLILGKE